MKPDLRAFAIEVLGYHPRWLELGVAPESLLLAQQKVWADGEDRSPEHYRAAAFRRWLEARDTLSEAELEAYLSAYEATGDDVLKPNHLHELVRHGGLTDAQLTWLAGHPLFQDGALPRIIRRRQLQRRLRAEGATGSVSEAILNSRDGVLQRALVESEAVPHAILERLATSGANRAVRSLAKVALDRKSRDGSST